MSNAKMDDKNESGSCGQVRMLGMPPEKKLLTYEDDGDQCENEDTV